MRFTWGHAAIAIPVTIVVVFTSVLIRSMADDKNTELVTEDYYAKEIQFQDQIDRTKSALELNTKIDWVKVDANWQLILLGDFDPTMVKGEIQVYRPSDSKLDLIIPLGLEADGTQLISSKNFQKGKYQIQVKWTVDGADCYLGKNIFID
jgi:hypothetical protein